MIVLILMAIKIVRIWRLLWRMEKLGYKIDTPPDAPDSKQPSLEASSEINDLSDGTMTSRAPLIKFSKSPLKGTTFRVKQF
jgi:hypothetical protein